MNEEKQNAKLPCDRTGRPIHVGDVIGWDDGTRIKVASMTHSGDGEWVAEGCVVGFSNNLGASFVVQEADNEPKAPCSNLRWLFEHDKWFNAMLRLSIVTKSDSGDIDLGGMTVDDWMFAEHQSKDGE